MIEINLIPPEMRGKKAAKIKASAPAGPLVGQLIVALATVAVIAVSGGFGWHYWSQVAGISSEVRKMQKQQVSMKKEYEQKFAENEEMKKKWDRVKCQEEILNVLVPEDPLIWSEKINMLSRIVPSGVYVTEILIEESTEMVETNHSQLMRKQFEEKKAKAKKEEAEMMSEPPVVKKPIIKQTMTVKAIAVGKSQDDRFAKMLQLEQNMRAYEMAGNNGHKRRFMDHFLPDVAFGQAELTRHENMDVWAFEFKLITQPLGYTDSTMLASR